MGHFLEVAFGVARKDLQLELRSRERTIAMLTFAALVAVVFSFALDPTVRALSFAGAMLWVTVLLAGLLGLGRSFAFEREHEALTAVLLAPVSPAAVFLGKALANLLILLVVEAAIFPVYALFFGLSFRGSLPALALVVFLASAGFMTLGTLFSGMAMHTRLGETLIPVLLLPLMIPVIIFAASATQKLLVGRPWGEIDGNLRMLLAFDLIYLFVCPLLFSSVMEE